MGKYTMLGKITEVIFRLPFAMLGVLYDLTRKLLSEAGQQWLAELKNFLRKKNCWTGIASEIFSQVISGDKILTICKISESGIKGEIFVEVRELIKDATFPQMFGELNADIGKLCFDFDQTEEFEKKYPDLMGRGKQITHFLVKSEKTREPLVRRIQLDPEGHQISTYLSGFRLDEVYHSSNQHRIIVPISEIS